MIKPTRIIVLFVLLCVYQNYAQVNNTAISYRKADSTALNFPRNKYYFYSETAEELAESFTTEKEKCRAIFRWISNNIKYDYNVLNDYKKDRVDPLIVYKSKKAVCAGYASLFQAMCEEAKIKCLYISGDANPSGGLGSSHAWNIVKLDGTWYVMDLTWASGYVSGVLSGSKFTKNFNEEWWMVDYEKAIKTHHSENSDWNEIILKKD